MKQEVPQGMLIDIQILQHEVPKDGSLEERFKAVVTLVKRGRAGLIFGGRNDDERFRICAGALIMAATEEERERINLELRHLQTLSAAISGVPVDFSALPVLENPIGLMRIWREALAE